MSDNKYKILVMGLPGSGKTYLTKRMAPILDAVWINADKVRDMANDWDFTEQGRLRQALRMKTFADFEKSQGRHVLCDFVCPLAKTREIFDPDIIIWMDTISRGRYKDTNKIFEPPVKYNFKIIEWNNTDYKVLANKIEKNDV